METKRKSELDPIIGLKAAAKDEDASDAIVRSFLYVLAFTPGIGPILITPLLSNLLKKKKK